MDDARSECHVTEPWNPTDVEKRVRLDVPGAARLWNFFLGGKDNYEVDRVAGRAALELYDFAAVARNSRQFLIRVVQYLVEEAGMRQFLDIGCGLPVAEGQNTHQVAQSIAPESRIVYMDNDPIVLAHTRALLVSTPEGVVSYFDVDYHDPDLVTTYAKSALNFNEPIAVMFMGSLGHARDYDTAKAIVAQVMDAVPSGSHLALWDEDDRTPNADKVFPAYAATGAVPYTPPSVEKIRRCFDGLEVVDPGLVDITQWRPNVVSVGREAGPHVTVGGVARKP
jgi:hypothetical protein